jgi:SAM-dependent methyltransferase
MKTEDRRYTARLLRLEGPLWKKVLGVQLPYRWNVRRLHRGLTLEIGCGIGRNLRHLAGHSVGVDHNPESVAIAKTRGLQAFTPEQFRDSSFHTPGRFDGILLAHVAEHMPAPEAARLLSLYVNLLRPGGRVTIITPQESGFRSDPTHVEFMGFDTLRQIAQANELAVVREYSFPFPRWAGRWFPYNEFVSVSVKPEEEAN